jgi:hypothetical protein
MPPNGACASATGGSVFSFDDDHQVIVVLRVLPRGRAYDR